MLFEENLRFLTARGSQKGGGQRCRPVLQRSTENGGHKPMTMKQAKDDYGFLSATLGFNDWKTNSTHMEDRLQTMNRHLPLGSRRLWRCLDL
jgi:hypothetical protein